ncbi:hypothetical protein GCM10007363_01380 [Pseudomonas fluvialis]|jgi:hypothetical protein|uniref:CdiI immunity protein domain-containing protein n=2 Tax=Pseudomonas fluvialis TaxID=1793966 RepID=A0ABQ2ACM4_9PSED|nr:hypothetical protein GCM10007363_01380 [Pseudomonas fluvialis]
MATMTIEDKSKFIDEVLGFYFGEPFLDGAKLFSSPESEVDSWYKFALVFDQVRKSANIPEKYYEALQLLVEDAISEYVASSFIGEDPDKEEELGVGYDGYHIPPDFAKNYQSKIWDAVCEIFSS